MIASATDSRVSVDNDLNEINLGDWTDVVYDSLRGDRSWQNYNSFRSCTKVPGGEMFVEVVCRVVKCLERLRREHRGDTVVIVSHSDVIKAALSHFMGIPIDLSGRIEISPSGVSAVMLGDDFVKIEFVNFAYWETEKG